MQIHRKCALILCWNGFSCMQTEYNPHLETEQSINKQTIDLEQCRMVSENQKYVWVKWYYVALFTLVLCRRPYKWLCYACKQKTVPFVAKSLQWISHFIPM